MRYAVPTLWEEIAYLAYYLHWPFAELLDLDHRSRTAVIAEVGRIHRALAPGASF
ncbi:hypothetical protein [Actinokineospora bangkokensis]|uniref:hypothetical protein n=1 Tax=Actinokineospora bangkokensis TaxID=1193682 RepID=UPI000AB8EA15|nr:hypothetical protein [Actinokineospora bangkokensis]